MALKAKREYGGVRKGLSGVEKKTRKPATVIGSHVDKVRNAGDSDGRFMFYQKNGNATKMDMCISIRAER
jgi:hypothetical protein